MLEPKRDDVSGLSPEASVSLINREESQQTFHRRPVGLTITVEKIDRVLANVQAQIESLRRYRMNLGMVKVQLAGMETRWRGE